MNQESLADRAVRALANVSAIGDELDSDHPMRHNVRSIKRAAEQILSDAITQAAELAYQAKQLVKDHDKAMDEVLSSVQGREG